MAHAVDAHACAMIPGTPRADLVALLPPYVRHAREGGIMVLPVRVKSILVSSSLLL